MAEDVRLRSSSCPRRRCLRRARCRAPLPLTDSPLSPLVSLRPMQMQQVAIQVATEAMQVADAEEKDVSSLSPPSPPSPRSCLLPPLAAIFERNVLTVRLDLQIAAHIKRDFDKRYGPTWHVVVGKSASSSSSLGTVERRAAVADCVSPAHRLRLVLHSR